MENDGVSQLADMFVALSDPTRLRLLGLIGDGEVSVGYLADELGESQPKVSRHLAYLRNAGLVSPRRDGKWVYYAIDPPENTRQRQILNDVLVSLGTPAPVSMSPVHERPQPILESADYEYRPNDIEIYLL